MTKLSTQEERIMLVFWKLGNCTVAQIIELYNVLDPRKTFLFYVQTSDRINGS